MLLAPRLEAKAAAARQWVRGQEQLPTLEDKPFKVEVPDSEWRRRSERVLEAEESRTRAHNRLRVAQAMVETLTDELINVEHPDPTTAKGQRRMTTGIPKSRIRRLEEQLGAAYAQVAEAKVYSDDAAFHLRRVRAAEEKGD